MTIKKGYREEMNMDNFVGRLCLQKRGSGGQQSDIVTSATQGQIPLKAGRSSIHCQTVEQYPKATAQPCLHHQEPL
ncbi:hypothetical protein E2C01_029873 [Portunus trituberculatus]|uniref:Uncharacterized protein n=1 Tax=Portunus trituberculatus TaxID=210409 RepID=A0A5B7ETE0_PORTR|nr:hypothetical protein [Portunus trituberculatus]